LIHILNHEWCKTWTRATSEPHSKILQFHNTLLAGTYIAWTLLGLGVSRCRTPTLIIILNGVIFSNYYRCRHVSIRVVSGVRVCVCASLAGTNKTSHTHNLYFQQDILFWMCFCLKFVMLIRYELWNTKPLRLGLYITEIYNYIGLCYFIKLLPVSGCIVSVLHRLT
jgi:hypothetical protein